MQNIENARSKAQQKRMKKLEEKGYCLFCKEGMQLLRKYPLYENEYWLLTENDYPYSGSEVHVMAVPKRHVRNPDDLKEKEVSSLFGDIIPYLSAKFGDRGFSCLFRFGNTKQTGATIEHLHIHFISGTERSGNDHEPIYAVVGFKGEQK